MRVTHAQQSGTSNWYEKLAQVCHDKAVDLKADDFVYTGLAASHVERHVSSSA